MEETQEVIVSEKPKKFGPWEFQEMVNHAFAEAKRLYDQDNPEWELTARWSWSIKERKQKKAKKQGSLFGEVA